MVKKSVSWLFVFLFLSAIGSVFAQSGAALSLDECIAFALKNNSSLRNAIRQEKVADTYTTTALANILPTVTTSFSKGEFRQGDLVNISDVPIVGVDIVQIPVYDIADPTKQIGVGFSGQPKLVGYEQQEVTTGGSKRDYNNFNLRVDQNIYDGGRWWNQIKQAKASLRASQFNHTATKQSVVRNVTLYYFQLLKALKLQEVYESAVTVADEQLKRTESMYEIGSVALVDVYKARVSLGENKINLVTQKNAVRIAKMNLNVAMGRNPDQELEVMEFHDYKIPDYNLASAIQAAVEKNPELKGLEEDANSAMYSAKVAKAQFLPNLGAGFSYTRSNSDFERVYTKYDKNYNYTIGLSVSWNLFNGFADKAAVEREQLNYHIAKENIVDRRRQIIAEIKQAFIEMQAWREASDINKENLESAKEELRLEQEKYRVGSGTLLDVTVAQSSLTNAQSTLVQAEYETIMAVVRLHAAMGVLEASGQE